MADNSAAPTTPLQAVADALESGAGSEHFLVNVKTLDEGVLKVRLAVHESIRQDNPSALPAALLTVANLKDELSRMTRLERSLMRLIFRGKVLGDNDTLQTHHIESGVTVHLVARSADPGIASPNYSALGSPAPSPSRPNHQERTPGRLSAASPSPSRDLARFHLDDSGSASAAGSPLRPGAPTPGRESMNVSLRSADGRDFPSRTPAHDAADGATAPESQPSNVSDMFGTSLLSSAGAAAGGRGSAGLSQGRLGSPGGGGTAGSLRMSPGAASAAAVYGHSAMDVAAASDVRPSVLGPGSAVLARPGQSPTRQEPVSSPHARAAAAGVRALGALSGWGTSARNALNASSSSAAATTAASISSVAGSVPALEGVMQSLHTVRTLVTAMGWDGDASLRDTHAEQGRIGEVDAQRAIEAASGGVSGPAVEVVERIPVTGHWSLPPARVDTSALVGPPQQQAAAGDDTGSGTVIFVSRSRDDGNAPRPGPASTPAAAVQLPLAGRLDPASGTVTVAVEQDGAQDGTAHASTVGTSRTTDGEDGAAGGRIVPAQRPFLSSTALSAAAAVQASQMELGPETLGTSPVPLASALARTRRYFAVGQWIDVLDTVDQWLEATVNRIRGEYVHIHYNGWPSRWDEWLHANSPRIAPFRTRSQHATLPFGMCPWPVNIMPESSPVGPPARLVADVSAAQAAEPPQQPTGKRRKTRGRATEAVHGTSASWPFRSLTPPLPGQLDNLATHGCASFDTPTVSVAVHLREEDPRPALIHAVDAVSMTLGLLTRLAGLGSEQVRREARRTALLSGVSSLVVYARDQAAEQQDEDEDLYHEFGAGPGEYSDSELSDVTDSDVEHSTAAGQGRAPAHAGGRSKVGGASAGIAQGRTTAGASPSLPRSPVRTGLAGPHAVGASPVSATGPRTAVSPSAGARQPAGSPGPRGAPAGHASPASLHASPVRPADYGGYRNYGDRDGVAGSVSPGHAATAGHARASTGNSAGQASASANIPLPASRGSDVESLDHSSGSLVFEASAGSSVPGGLDGQDRAADGKQRNDSPPGDVGLPTSAKKEKAVVIDASMGPESPTALDLTSAPLPMVEGHGGRLLTAVAATAPAVHVSSSFSNSAEDGKVDGRADSRAGPMHTDHGRASCQSGHRGQPGRARTASEVAAAQEAADTRARQARVRDYQQGLEDRTEIAVLAQQLAPLLDRVGRIMTDLAPHVETLGRAPTFVARQVITTPHAPERQTTVPHAATVASTVASTISAAASQLASAAAAASAATEAMSAVAERERNLQEMLATLRTQVSRVRADTHRLTSDVARLRSAGVQTGDVTTSAVSPGVPQPTPSPRPGDASSTQPAAAPRTEAVRTPSTPVAPRQLPREASPQAAGRAIGHGGLQRRSGVASRTHSSASSLQVFTIGPASRPTAGSIAIPGLISAAAGLGHGATVPSGRSTAGRGGAGSAPMPIIARRLGLDTPYAYARYVSTPALRDAAASGYTSLIRAPLTVPMDADVLSVRQPGYALRAGDGSLSLLHPTGRPPQQMLVPVPILSSRRRDSGDGTLRSNLSNVLGLSADGPGGSLTSAAMALAGLPLSTLANLAMSLEAQGYGGGGNTPRVGTPVAGQRDVEPVGLGSALPRTGLRGMVADIANGTGMAAGLGRTEPTAVRTATDGRSGTASRGLQDPFADLQARIQRHVGIETDSRPSSAANGENIGSRPTTAAGGAPGTETRDIDALLSSLGRSGGRDGAGGVSPSADLSGLSSDELARLYSHVLVEQYLAQAGLLRAEREDNAAGAAAGGRAGTRAGGAGIGAQARNSASPATATAAASITTVAVDLQDLASGTESEGSAQ